MSTYQKKKKKTAEERALEAQGASLFGKHVSEEKGRVLLIATLLACAAPMILGARMWSRIPEIVPSGLIGANGEDDSIPRWMVALGLPALMCLLDFLAHFQLRSHQKRMTVPPAYVRLVGRWGFPIISVLFCSGMIRQSVGAEPLPVGFLAPCVLGLLLLLLGSHMFDCPKTSRIALRFSFTENNDKNWLAVHRCAGWCWLAAGLLVIVATMLTETASPVMAALVLVAMAAPIVYGYTRASKLS